MSETDSDYSDESEPDYDYLDEKEDGVEFDSKEPEDLLKDVKTLGYKKGDYPYQIPSLLKGCEYCTKHYIPDMIIAMDGISICQHCYFWTHYNEAVRESGDGKYGVYISEYIKNCKEDHDMTECANSPMYGFCFICDFLHGEQLKWIKKREVLFGEEEPDDNNRSSSGGESDDEFTIEI